MLSRGKALQSSLKQGDLVPRFPPCFVKLTNIPTPLAQYSFSCPICNKEFTLEKNLIRHMKIPSNLCFHQAAHQPSSHPVNSPTYKCDICSSQFAHKNSLVKHQSKGSCSNIKYTRKKQEENNNESKTEQTFSSSDSSGEATMASSSPSKDHFLSPDLICFDSYHAPTSPNPNCSQVSNIPANPDDYEHDAG